MRRTPLLIAMVLIAAPVAFGCGYGRGATSTCAPEDFPTGDYFAVEPIEGRTNLRLTLSEDRTRVVETFADADGGSWVITYAVNGCSID